MSLISKLPSFLFCPLYPHASEVLIPCALKAGSAADSYGLPLFLLAALSAQNAFAKPTGSTLERIRQTWLGTQSRLRPLGLRHAASRLDSSICDAHPSSGMQYVLCVANPKIYGSLFVIHPAFA